MSTSPQPLQYLWTAWFDDGTVIKQPADDRYSKHEDDADNNPSAFRDIIDHQKKANLIYFDINDDVFAYGIDLPSGRFGINGTWFSLEDISNPIKDRKLIYYRTVDKDIVLNTVVEKDGKTTTTIDEKEPRVIAYYFGYEGKNASGKIETKVIRIDAKNEEPTLNA